MAALYEEEGQNFLMEELQNANAPLQIPIDHLDWSYAYSWKLRMTGAEGDALRAFEPLLTSVDCMIQNYRSNKQGLTNHIDTNPGSLLRNCYDNAFLLARRRFNFRVPELDNALGNADNWIDANPSSTPMNWTDFKRGHPGYEANPNARNPQVVPRLQRGQRAFSMVKVIISNMPHEILNRNDGPTTTIMASDNVFIRPADPMMTCRRLYTSLAHKHFAGSFDLQTYGSGASLVFPLIPSDDIQVTFQFMFVKGPHWTPLAGRIQRQIQKSILFRPTLGRPVVLRNNYEAPVVNYPQGAAAAVAVPPLNPIRHPVLRGLAGSGMVNDEDEYAEEPLPRAMREGIYSTNPLRPRPSVNAGSSSSSSSSSSNRSSMITRSMSGASRHAHQLRRILPSRVSGRRTGPVVRFGAKTGDNAYAKMKEKIYIRRDLGDFFTHSKACISVPETEEELCIPMAIMRCQQRIWNRKEDPDTHVLCDEYDNLEEMIPYKIHMDDDFANQVRPPNDRTTSFFDGESINVFSCMKKEVPRTGQHGKTFYYNEAKDTEGWEIELWKWCAQRIHAYVEEVWGEDIDVHDLYGCLEAYSYVFQVHISLFAMEMKGERIFIQTVPTKEDLKQDKFIALILQNNHVHAISNIRDYHRSQINPHRTCLHSYCDFCNTTATARKWSHARECSKLDWKITASLDTLYASEASKLEFRNKYHHLIGEKKIQLMCNICHKKDTCCNCEEEEGGVVLSTRPVTFVQCKTCSEEIPLNFFNDHVCYMKARKPKEKLNNSTIFVYDIESMQTYNEEIEQYVHECILVCLRAVYDDRKWKFNSIREFVIFLLETKEMHGSVILAHNGGGYDHQFVLRYLEDNGIDHSTVPRPNTVHKYLMLQILMTGESTAIKFLDFMMMMSDSLRNIGKAFKLDVCKGDFPHRFSRKEHLNYKGPLPPMDAQEDWYSFKEVKNQEELNESRSFWKKQADVFCTCYGEICNCVKPKWDFQMELEKYCWLDVDVLAGACKAYRDQALNFNGESDYSWRTHGIEPFQYMTQSQIALALFLQGKEQNNIAITHEKLRYSFNPNQILWMESLMERNRTYSIQHAGNSFKEYYDTSTNTYLDGYCKNTKTVFEYLQCALDGCPSCYADEISRKEMNEYRGIKWDFVASETQSRLLALQTCNNYSQIVVRWSHEDENEGEESPTASIRSSNPTLGNLMHLRDFFYGGRTEVFAAYANPAKFANMELLHHDVCSLYPYVCSWKELPIGIPDIYFYHTVEKTRLHPLHSNRYFGYARIRVRPNPKDLIAVLPQRIKGENGDEKLIYDLLEKEGCWHTELIYLAMERQYEILEVYEVWHWSESQRSSTLMRGYMEFFLRMKQEAEGWGKLGKNLIGNKPENEITELEKDQIADMIYTNNGGFAKPRKEKVDKNPVLRQLAKIFLNCLWGKLCQKGVSEHERSIYGYKQYLEILNNPLINPQSLKFRHVNGCVFKIRYELMDTLQENNRFLNIPIAASVTAHAQVILMRQMYKIGPERVLYCDTDSIIFFREKGRLALHKSGLGNWENEHPGEIITRFWALAPKCYMMEIQEPHVTEAEYHFKCKGVRSTEENRRRTSFDKVHALIEAAYLNRDLQSIVAKTMTIHPNSTNAAIPYGILCTRYGDKIIQAVFSKRWMLKFNANDYDYYDDVDPKMEDVGIVRLLPFGYKGSVVNTL